MAKKLVFIFLAVLSSMSLNGQNYHGPDYYFCAKISATWNKPSSYFVAYYDGRYFSKLIPVSSRSLFLQITGKEKSEANPLNENLLVKYGIYDIAVEKVDPDPTNHFRYHKQFYPRGAMACYDPYTELQGDTIMEICYLTTLDSLWKLRYYVYPFKLKSSKDTLGWTNNKANPWMPTTAQKQLLASYGMDTVTFIIFGQGLFKLLKDMNDPVWIQNYKSLGNGNDNTTSTAEN